MAELARKIKKILRGYENKQEQDSKEVQAGTAVGASFHPAAQNCSLKGHTVKNLNRPRILQGTQRDTLSMKRDLRKA